MSFHLGKPILMMLAIAAVAAAAIALRPSAPPRADLTLWVFAGEHVQTYRGPLLEEYRRLTGKSVEVRLLNIRAENIRLESSFMSAGPPESMPDLAEIEIGDVGKYFRPPADEIGFVRLNDYLDRSPWKDQVVAARFAPWTKEGNVYGLPHDVHPVTLSYRADLFAEAGVDLEKPRNWKEFQEACLRFQDYWRQRGYPHRHAIELAASSSGDLEIILLQRHLNMIDDFNRIHLDDPKVARTLAFYAQLVAGPRAIGAHSSGQEGAETQDFEQGNLCAFFTPDWRIAPMENNAADLAGKMRMRPLPIFEEGDSITSTWGGTMLGILKSCPHPDEAWKLAQFLYFSRPGIEARQRTTHILPPVKSMWGDAIYQRPDPFFGGQKVDALYIELAKRSDFPNRYVTPATPIASAILSVALMRATAYVEKRGTDGLEEACQQWLKEGALDLQRRIDHSRFDPDPGQ